MEDSIERLDRHDEQILSDVRELYARLDPCPAGLTDRIKFALTVQALNADVAELTKGVPTGVRSEGIGSPALTGTITFTTPERSIVVSASDAGEGRRRVDGWVTGGAASVELHSVDPRQEVQRVIVDDDGRFVFDRVQPGPVWFLIRSEPNDPDGRPVLTPTFTL